MSSQALTNWLPPPSPDGRRVPLSARAAPRRAPRRAATATHQAVERPLYSLRHHWWAQRRGPRARAADARSAQVARWFLPSPRLPAVGDYQRVYRQPFWEDR